MFAGKQNVNLELVIASYSLYYHRYFFLSCGYPGAVFANTLPREEGVSYYNGNDQFAISLLCGLYSVCDWSRNRTEGKETGFSLTDQTEHLPGQTMSRNTQTIHIQHINHQNVDNFLHISLNVNNRFLSEN